MPITKIIQNKVINIDKNNYFDNILKLGPIWTNYGYILYCIIAFVFYMNTKNKLFIVILISGILVTFFSFMHHYFYHAYTETSDKGNVKAKIFSILDDIFANLTIIIALLIVIIYIYKLYKKNITKNIYIYTLIACILVNISIAMYCFFVAEYYDNKYVKSGYSEIDYIYCYDWYHSIWHLLTGFVGILVILLISIQVKIDKIVMK